MSAEQVPLGYRKRVFGKCPCCGGQTYEIDFSRYSRCQKCRKLTPTKEVSSEADQSVRREG